MNPWPWMAHINVVVLAVAVATLGLMLLLLPGPVRGWGGEDNAITLAHFAFGEIPPPLKVLFCSSYSIVPLFGD